MNKDNRNLPDGWRWVKLGDVCNIIMGQSPPSESYKTEPQGLPFFQGKADFGKVYPTPRVWCIEPIKIADVGDILISVRAPVGPTNLVNLNCCIGRGLAAIRCNQDSERDFIHTALKLYENKLVALGSGSTFEAISRKDLETLEIPLPPLPEQKRIATILNEQIAAVEQARKATQAQLEAAAALPAAYLRSVFNSEEAKNWERKRLGDMVKVIRGSSPRPKGDPEYYGGNVPRLLVEDVTRDGMYVTPKIDYLTEKGAKLSRPMNKGDVVMVVSGTPGLPSILAVDACIHDGFAGFKEVNPKIINNEYLFYFLKYFHSQADSEAVGAIFRNLTTDQIRNFSFALPKINDQQRIATHLNEKLTECDRLKQTLQEQLEAINQLPAALLRRAFNGEL